MKVNRKRVIITVFVLLDFIMGAVILGRNNVKTSTTSLMKKNLTSANKIVDKVNDISDGFSNMIGVKSVSQEDLIVSQSIMMNDVSNNAKKTEVVSTVLNTAKTSSKKSRETLEDVEEKQRREKEQEIIINTKITTKNGMSVVNFAKQFNGNPYVMGGNSLIHGTDCSGFTKLIYEKFGVELPRTAAAQAKVGTEVSINAIQPGDLVFYSSGQDYVTHVAIYMGNGQIIHARTRAHGIGVNSIFIMRRLHIRRVLK